MATWRPGRAFLKAGRNAALCPSAWLHGTMGQTLVCVQGLSPFGSRRSSRHSAFTHPSNLTVFKCTTNIKCKVRHVNTGLTRYKPKIQMIEYTRIPTRFIKIQIYLGTKYVKLFYQWVFLNEHLLMHPFSLKYLRKTLTEPALTNNLLLTTLNCYQKQFVHQLAKSIWREPRHLATKS